MRGCPPWVGLLLGCFLAGALGLAQAPQGAGIYSVRCSGCHQANGLGLPGVFPPLAGHIPQILKAKGGREYLLDVLLVGLEGEIAVGGVRYSGAMPGFKDLLTDAEIASLLNWMAASWGNAPPQGHRPYTPEEVRARRAQRISPAQLLQVRRGLGL